MKLAKLSAISVLLLFIHSGGGQPELECNASNTRPTWRTKLPDGSIFFPYSWCLAFKILNVKPHLVHQYKTDDAELDIQVKVEYVLREGTQTSHPFWSERGQEVKETPIQKGDIITLCLSKEPNLDLRKFVSSLKNKTQVWAFSTPHRNNNGKRLRFRISDRFEPFHNQTFSSNDLKELAAGLAPVINDPQKAKLPIEKYLRDRWTEKRIREFCQKDNRLVIWKAIPDPVEFGCYTPEISCLRGVLYPKSQLGEVMWIADTTNNTPTSYAVSVKDGKNLWQLDRSCFELGVAFNDDDALKKRIHDTLTFAQGISFDAHPPKQDLTKEEHSIQAYSSSTPLPFMPDWKAFTVERERGTGKVVAVSCETSSGRLRAILDSKKTIRSVTMGGKQDNEWIKSLAEANKKRAELYDQ